MNRVYQIVILILFGVILYLQMCSKPKPSQPTIVVKTDTLWKKDSASHYTDVPKPDTQWLPSKPYKVYIPLEPVYLTKAVDTAAIVREYEEIWNAARVVSTYEDSVIRPYATARSYDTIQFNRLIGRRLTLVQNTPTIVKTVENKQKIQLYGGVSILGTSTALVDAVEVSLSLKNKKDQQYELGVSKPWNRGLQIRLGTKFKFSFKK